MKELNNKMHVWVWPNGTRYASEETLPSDISSVEVSVSDGVKHILLGINSEGVKAREQAEKQVDKILNSLS